MRAFSGLSLGAALLGLQDPAIAQEIAPKIVLQAAASAPEIAAWSPDDRYLVTARASNRELLVWEVASGNIVNRIALPSQGDYVEFAAMKVEADGRTVRIQVAVIQPEVDCRAEIYTIDLATGTLALPASIVSVARLIRV